MIKILLKRKFLLVGGIFTTFVFIRFFASLNFAADTDNFKVAYSRDNAAGRYKLLESLVDRGSAQHLREFQGRVCANGSSKTMDTVFPSVYTYLPHLISSPDKAWPELYISKGRTNVNIVIGVPSIKRPKGVYVYDTVQSLLAGMNEAEKSDAVIVVCLTEPQDKAYEMQVIGELMARYPSEISQGLLEIITPYPELYPDFDNIKPTLGDSLERAKWRSKQNIDYAFLMLHSWRKGEYYLQLEDDVKAAPGFVTSIKEAIKKNAQSEWFTLEFSSLGFIGRLFKSEDVPKMLEFLLMFYAQKPCDWLYADYLKVKVCGNGDKWPECINKMTNIARPMKPSLFQHEGLHSSLGGTVNKLKDKDFGTDSLNDVQNPPVESIITTLEEYLNHNIYAAYSGSAVFWAKSPKEGDLIDFLFEEPIQLASVQIASGNAEHAEDIFQNATIEVLPIKMPSTQNKIKKYKGRSLTKQQKYAYEQRISKISDLKHLPANDTFFIVGEFNKRGVASVKIPEDLGKVWVLRIHVHSTSQTWVLIKQIVFTVR